jgi:hypothetical protein
MPLISLDFGLKRVRPLPNPRTQLPHYLSAGEALNAWLQALAKVARIISLDPADGPGYSASSGLRIQVKRAPLLIANTQ